MADFVKIASIHDVTNGNMKTFIVRGRPVALANVDGEFFAVDDNCSHEECSLGSEGFLDGTTIICGCHGSQFDVASGKVLSLPAPTDIKTYPVKIEAEDVFVEM